MNLFLATPGPEDAAATCIARAWHAGLKTTYYLRTLGASNIEKATVAVKKEVRGAIKEGAGRRPKLRRRRWRRIAPQVKADAEAAVMAAKKTYTAAEKTACSIEAMRNGGECEACQ